MAEAVFRDKIKKANLTDQITVDSAGTSNWHEGKAPHEGTRDKLDELGISYEGMKARQVKVEDFSHFDYIIAMDNQNIADLHSIEAKNDGVVLRKLMDFVENPKETEVPDPYYTGDFDYTYELVDEATEKLLQYIVEEHQLKG